MIALFQDGRQTSMAAEFSIPILKQPPDFFLFFQCSPWPEAPSVSSNTSSPGYLSANTSYSFPEEWVLIQYEITAWFSGTQT